MLPEFYCDPEGDAMSKSPGHWDRPLRRPDRPDAPRITMTLVRRRNALVVIDAWQGRRYSARFLLGPGVYDACFYPRIDIGLAEKDFFPNPNMGEALIYQLENACAPNTLVQTGKLQAFKAGRAWRIRREDLERFMQPQAATKRETAKIPAAVDCGERRRQ
jgi:hypothetical protein